MSLGIEGLMTQDDSTKSLEMRVADLVDKLAGPTFTDQELAAYLLSPPPRVEDNFTAITSSGLAAGADLTQAVLGALNEVIERDAFKITWLHRVTATLNRTPEKG